VNYITEEVQKLIGFESELEEACDPVERGQIRRHVQAVMDRDPIYFDDDYASQTRFGGIVAPPLFPLHAVTRSAPDSPDPLDPGLDDPDYDAAHGNLLRSCVPLPMPLKRIMNGGSEFEIFRLARPGETIRARSRYADIYQKEGRSGPIVFWVIETVYTTTDGELLLKARNTRIVR
jgi:acyl dehydratase